MDAKFLLTIIVVVAMKEGAANPRYEVSGGDAAVLTGETVTLKCQFTKLDNQTDDPIPIWKDGSTEVLFLDNRPVQSDRIRMSSTGSRYETQLVIKDVVISDEGDYVCGLNGLRPPIYHTNKLTVNQYPQQFYVVNFDTTLQDGNEASVAKCITKGTKPEPKMWFTDPNGDVVPLIDNAEVVISEDGLVDKNITLKKTFAKSDNGKNYLCHVERVDSTTETRETAQINVQFSPSVMLDSLLQNSLEIREEGNPFEATCVAQGNPTPTITWQFVPNKNTNVTLPIGENLPRNWQSYGSRIISNGLLKSTVGSTNNGTFTCTADNGVGSPVSASFSLGVYAAPVTTVPTTAALPDVTTKQKESTAVAEPRTAGSNGAVIGGVVAVAAFVIIVAILLIARYFMSHKGTYRTKETKFEDDAEKGDPAVDEDEEFLAERKKTEYFL